MWHEVLYQILNNINNVILMMIGIPFGLQLIYMLFFWVKKKVFPKSEKKAKVAFLIPAHNESDVIFDTVKEIKDRQNYPSELIDIYVICHNCDDDTAKLVQEAGGIPLIYNNDNPKEKFLAYALNYGFKYLMDLDKKYDFIIRLDADNHINKDFTSLMNDAFQDGCDFARPYESAINMTQNRYTKACGLYYIFDSRFSSRVRERLHIGAHINGPGTMISMKALKEKGGYNCTSISEDCEFMIDLMDRNVFGHFVEDAVVYEDLPSSFIDTYKRNIRIGSGSRGLIFGKLGKLFLKFFYRFKFSYLELFLTYFFNIICVILCTWIPLFYIYDVIYLALCGNGIIETINFTSSFYMTTLYNTLIIMGIALGVLFMFCGIFQGVLLVLLDYKKMGAKRRRDLLDGAFLFPAFTVVYCLTICLGMFSKPKWGKVSRNKQNSFEIDELDR